MFRLLQMMYGFQMLNADGLKWYVEKGRLTQDEYQQITGVHFNQTSAESQSSAIAEALGSSSVQSASSSTSASGQPTNIQQ